MIFRCAPQRKNVKSKIIFRNKMTADLFFTESSRLPRRESFISYVIRFRHVWMNGTREYFSRPDITYTRYTMTAISEISRVVAFARSLARANSLKLRRVAVLEIAKWNTSRCTIRLQLCKSTPDSRASFASRCNRTSADSAADQQLWISNTRASTSSTYARCISEIQTFAVEIPHTISCAPFGED